VKPLSAVKINNRKLKDYLLARYPEKMCDTMMKYLDLPGSTKFDTFA
jgi:hypothetical protein